MTECHFPKCELQNDCIFKNTGAVHECPHVKKATCDGVTIVKRCYNTQCEHIRGITNPECSLDYIVVDDEGKCRVFEERLFHKKQETKQ